MWLCRHRHIWLVIKARTRKIFAFNPNTIHSIFYAKTFFLITFLSLAIIKTETTYFLITPHMEKSKLYSNVRIKRSKKIIFYMFSFRENEKKHRIGTYVLCRKIKQLNHTNVYNKSAIHLWVKLNWKKSYVYLSVVHSKYIQFTEREKHIKM